LEYLRLEPCVRLLLLLLCYYWYILFLLYRVITFVFSYIVCSFLLIFSGSTLGCSVGVALYSAPSFSSGDTLHYDLLIVTAVGVVGLLGMVRCTMFVSEFYVVMFRYVPSFNFVLWIGSLYLRLYYCVELLVRLIVLPKFYV
jgi:hypothetical protein